MVMRRRRMKHIHLLDRADVPRVEQIVEGDRSIKHPLRAHRARLAMRQRARRDEGRRVTAAPLMKRVAKRRPPGGMCIAARDAPAWS